MSSHNTQYSKLQRDCFKLAEFAGQMGEILERLARMLNQFVDSVRSSQVGSEQNPIVIYDGPTAEPFTAEVLEWYVESFAESAQMLEALLDMMDDEVLRDFAQLQRN